MPTPSTRSTGKRARRLSGNAKDICVAEAKGKNDIARAEAAVAYENTPKTRENARVAHARAAYDVSMEKCDDLAGNHKDVCVKEAKAALVRGKADAKVDRVAGDTRKDASAKQADAVQGSERREARRRLQGRDREMRRVRGAGEGCLRRQREGADTERPDGKPERWQTWQRVVARWPPPAPFARRPA